MALWRHGQHWSLRVTWLPLGASLVLSPMGLPLGGTMVLVAFGRYASILWFRTSFTHWEAVIVCYPLGHSILLTNCSIWTNNFDLSYFFASEPKNLVFFRPVNVLSQLCFLIPSGNRASTWYTKLDYATFLLWSFIDQKPFGVLLVLPSPWK